MTNRDAINLLEEVKMLDDTMYAYNPCYEEALSMAISALEQPEVIQCKDCKYWDSTGYCLYGSRLAWRGNYNDYCSCAKRREE